MGEVQLEGGVLKETFARLGLPLNIGLEVGTLDSVKRYVERGLGVAVVSGLCVEPQDRLRLDVVDVPKEFRADSTYGVVMRRDKRRGALLQSLLGLLGGKEAASASR